MINNSDVVKRQPEGAVFHSDWDNFDQLVSDVYVVWSVQWEIVNNHHMFVIEMIVIAISGNKTVLLGQILCLKAELQYGIYYICNDTSLLLSLK